VAQADSREALRKEATKLQAQAQPRDATAQLRVVLDQGTLGERQNALATLAALTNSTAADDLLSQWLDRLLAKELPPELHLDLLEAASRRITPGVREKWQRYERARPAEDSLRSYRECLVGGNAEEGKKVFFEKAEASCVRCHKINGEGGEVGPDLSGFGAKKDRQYLLESITFPNAHIAEGFDNALVTMKNGTAYAGVVKREDDATLEIVSPEDGPLKLSKSEIKSRERGLSAMPEELRQILTKHDLRNLVEYLAGLK
jgi:quinoprotein glucose dehydrogenase